MNTKAEMGDGCTSPKVPTSHQKLEIGMRQIFIEAFKRANPQSFWSWTFSLQNGNNRFLLFKSQVVVLCCLTHKK